MKRKVLLIYLLFILINQSFAQEKEQKKWEVFIGGNYTELYTTKNKGKHGFIIGIYRRMFFNDRWRVKYGLNLNRKQYELKNVSVKSDHLSGENIIYYYDMDNYHLFSDIDVIAERSIIRNRNFDVYFLVGVGLEIFLYNNSESKLLKKMEYSIEQQVETDYNYGTHSHPVEIAYKIANCGFKYMIGTGVSYNDFMINIYHTKSLHDIKYIEDVVFENIVFEEKFHSFSVVFGKNF